MINSIHESESICKALSKYNLCGNFTRNVMKHIFAILISVFVYKGKTAQFAANSPCHRTTVAHFLNKGKWDSAGLERRLKKAVICRVGSDQPLSFEDGYAFFQRAIHSERIEFIYQCAYAHIPLEHVLSLVA